MWKWLYNIFFSILWGLMEVLDTIYNLIILLAGGTPSDEFLEAIGGQEAAQESNSLLSDLVLNSNVKTIFLIMIGVAGVLTAFSFVIAFIRTEVSAEDDIKSKKKLYKSTAKSVALIFLIPLIVWFALTLINAVITSLVGFGNDTGMSLTGIVVAVSNGTNIPFRDALYEGELFSTMPWNEISKITIDNMRNFYGLSNYDEFGYFLGILFSLIMIIMLALIVVQLVERLIILALLYIASPIVLAVMPLDDGNRFGIWKDLFISKLISAVSIIVCFQIYYCLMSVLSQWFTSDLGCILNAVLCIVGLFAVTKGSHYMANLVGYSTGLAESHSQLSTIGAMRTIIGVGKSIGRMASGSSGGSDQSGIGGEGDTKSGDGSGKSSENNSAFSLNNMMPNNSISDVRPESGRSSQSGNGTGSQNEQGQQNQLEGSEKGKAGENNINTSAQGGSISDVKPNDDKSNANGQGSITSNLTNMAISAGGNTSIADVPNGAGKKDKNMPSAENGAVSSQVNNDHHDEEDGDK